MTFNFLSFYIGFVEENGTPLHNETYVTNNDEFNTTINYAENEIDINTEKEVKNGKPEIFQEANKTDFIIISTEIPRPAITLAQPPRLPNRPRFSVGPFFEDGPEPQNVTAKLGTIVLLDCKIGLLYDKTVSKNYLLGNILV